MPRVSKIVVPGAIITRKSTGASRTVVSVDGQSVIWRDEFGEGYGTVKGMLQWKNHKPKWFRELEKRQDDVPSERVTDKDG